MPENTKQQLFIPVDLKLQPLSIEEIETRKKQNSILGAFVLGAAVTYRVISLGYDTEELELFKVSLYIGLWFGLFAGLMIGGNAKRCLKMAIVSIVVSISSSLFMAMIVTLMMGGFTDWISGVNVLGGALGGMWMLIRYNAATKGLESVGLVDKEQFLFIKKIGMRFDEIDLFNHKVAKQERIPTVGEFWAMENWLAQNQAS